MAGSPWAGSEELWAAMANAALEEGHEVTVAVYRWEELPARAVALRRRGASVIQVPRESAMLFKALRKLFGGRALVRKILERRFSPFKSLFNSRPDVVCLSQGGTYECLYIPGLLAWLHRNSVPYVAISQLSGDQYVVEGRAPNEALRFLNRAARVAFVSEHNLAVTERQMATRLRNARVVQNPVNLQDLDIVDWPISEPLRMACVARLDVQHKAQDVLLEALSSPAWRDRNWHVTFYGSGPDREYLERLAGYYDLSKSISFSGHVVDIRSIWRENHLFVLASRLEGTPLALVEAMICGRPAVVTDVGGNTEWIEDGESGFIAAAPTARSFGATLERAWQQQANWQKMGQRAHQSATSKIDRTPGKSLLKMLLEAAGQPKPMTFDQEVPHG